MRATSTTARPRTGLRLSTYRQRAPARCSATPVAAAAAHNAGVGSKTLTSWLLAQEKAGAIDLPLVTLLSSISSACQRISSLVARAPIDGGTGLAASGANASGDEQKKLDVLANDVFARAVADSGRCSVLVSEELDQPVAVSSSGGYIACFDPIDGSSNIDAAIPTGSIFGVYAEGECVIDPDADAPDALVEKCLTNARQSGTELVAAGYCLFSSSTVLVLTVKTGVYGFTLDRTMGEFVLSHPGIRIPDPGQRIISGNLGNVLKWAPSLQAYLSETVTNRPDGAPTYSYRYVGALVADFHRTLLYGGIWLYPPDSSAPSGKARLLYEVAPMSLLAEQAGGLATWGPTAEQRVLEVVPSGVHARSPLFTGSASEVKRLQQFLRTHK
jgi:fructose-1,6-bisphosphatase I